MTPHRLLAILRRRYLIIIAALVVVLAATVFLTQRKTPVYQSTVKIFASTTVPQAAGSDLLNSSLYATDQVKTFAQVLRTPAVLDEVIEELDLDLSAGALAQKITVNIPLNTVIMEVTVSDSGPNTAAAIANEIAKALPDAIDDLTKPSKNEPAPMRLETIQPATPSSAAVSPNLKVNLIAGGVLGLVLGLGLALLAEAFRRRLTSVVDVEEITGLPVLGVLAAGSDEMTPAGRTSARMVWASMVGSSGPAPRTILLASLAESSSTPKLAARLASVIAETDRSVAWLDTDLLGGRVSSALDVPSSPGLSDLLAGTASLDEVVVPWQETSFSVIPAGSDHGDFAPLVTSPAMGSTVTNLRAGFETLILDGTAATSTSDLTLLGQYADSVVLIITPSLSRTDLAQATREMVATGLRVVGIVVDDVLERDRADFERRINTSGDVILD